MTRGEELQAMLLKAERSVYSARLLAADGSYDFAVSRAYYGAFYAMEAALSIHNVRATTHSGIIGEFNKIFLKTEELPKEFGKSIGTLFRERQTADYEYFDMIPPNKPKRIVSLQKSLFSTFGIIFRKTGIWNNLLSHLNLNILAPYICCMP